MKTNQSWTAEEEEMLKQLVISTQNHNCWTEIAQKFNISYPERTRFGKQCRDRFINHINIQQSTSSANSWTRQQTVSLISMYKQMGSKWTQISKRLPGKSENCVKNKFYGSLRKTVTSLNMQFRQVCNKSKKQMRFKSIMRVFEYAEGKYRIQTQLFSQSVKLRDTMLNWTLNQQTEATNEDVMKLVSDINEFSIAIRSYKLVRLPKKNVVDTQIGMGSIQIYTDKNQMNQTTQKSDQREKSRENQMQLLGSLCKQNENQQCQILSGELKRQYQQNLKNKKVELKDIFQPDVEENQIQQWERIFHNHFLGQLQSPLINDLF